MSKWKCDICNSEFNNYHAEGFNNKIYCPLCYYKHEYNDLQQQLSQLKQEKKELIEWLQEEIKNGKELQKVADDYMKNAHEIIIFTYTRVLERLGE